MEFDDIATEGTIPSAAGWLASLGTSTWSTPGDYRGSYRQLPTIAPLGVPAGSEDSGSEGEIFPAQPGRIALGERGRTRCPKPVFAYVTVGFAVLATLTLFVGLGSPSAPDADFEAPLRREQMVVATRNVTLPTASPPRDLCQYQSIDEVSTWPSEHRIHCCKTVRVACPIAQQSIETPAPRYDCGSGSYITQLLSWSPAKRSWCCQNHNRGCTQKPTTPAPRFDCKAGLLKWQSGWAEGKKTWCCRRYRVGCPFVVQTAPSPTEPAEVYDCAENLYEWEQKWTGPRKSWCCHKYQVGCPFHQQTTTVGDYYDCNFGYGSWRTSWTDAKKAWCCDDVGRGCSQNTTNEPFDCMKGWPGWVNLWSSRKKEYCCKDYGKGCPTTTVQVVHDCSDDVEAAWTRPKKDFCCHQVQRGCPQPLNTGQYDCNADAAEHVHWPQEQKHWCCKQVGLGCTQTTSWSFDCYAGYSNWERGWSNEKKRFCCKDVGRGCTTTTSHRSYSGFDCDADHHSWQTHWHEEKRQWCCERKNRGCSYVASDCESHQAVWTTHKKTWCCQNHRRGCGGCETDGCADAPSAPSAPCPSTEVPPCPVTYDCDDGLPEWESGWTSKKKAYCCKHVSRGCVPETTEPLSTVPPCPGGATSTASPCGGIPDTTTRHFDCSDADFAEYWDSEQISWCCEHEGKGCPTTTLLRTIDCSDRNSLTSWTANEKVNCCASHNNGCPFECEEGSEQVAEAWNKYKRDWCCRHRSRGCATPLSTSSRYDCMADIETWQYDWDQPRREWCCQNVGVGCNTVTSTVTETTTTISTTAYDCLSDVEYWRSKYDRTDVELRKAWCCEYKGMHCNTRKPMPCSKFKCPIGFSLRGDADTRFCWDKECNENVDVGTCCDAPRYQLSLNPTCDTRNWECPSASNYFEKEDQSDIHCSSNPCDPATDMLTCCNQALVCELNCYGDAATPVFLSGAKGSGDGAFVPGLSRSECRDECLKADDCDAIVFGEDGGQCYGRQEIHTSRCQPGHGKYFTEVLTERPWGKCVLMGDPHIVTMDRPQGPAIDELAPGIYWLIKSSKLLVQGRFSTTSRFPDAASTVGIAAFGELFGGELIVDYVGSQTDFGPDAFEATWNGKRIFASEDNKSDHQKWNSADGDLQAKFGLMDPSGWHPEARHTIGDEGGDLHCYTFFFSRASFNIYLILGPDSMNVILEAKKAPGPQDGLCGNFDCNSDNDAVEALRSRGMTSHILGKENKFKESSTQDTAENIADASDVLKDCTDKPQIEVQCKELPVHLREGCIFDACAATSKTGEHSVEKTDAATWAQTEKLKG